MPHLHLSFFGAFQATLNGKPITNFRSSRVQGLLAHLVLEAERPHGRETLAALFWPDEGDSTARKNLSQSLYQLRQVLGESETQPFQPKPFLLITRETIQWNTTSDYRLDVADFLAHLEKRDWETAVPLYQGDLLTGFTCDSLPFEDWLRLERERLHYLALDALYELAQQALARTDTTAAQTYARRQLALAPWREEAWRQLMLALALAGDRSAALAQYAACAEVLDAELGVAPDGETAALYEAIKAGKWDNNRRPKRVVGTAVPHNLPPSPTDFVGREQELAALDALIQESESHLVTIIGPGGMGKTRFSLAYAARCLADEPLALTLFPDGVFFVSLVSLEPAADLPVPDQLSLAITRALNLPLSGSEGQSPRTPAQQLLDYLPEKRLFLLLDNFEQLLGESSGTTLLAEILRAAPHVRIIVTSRERLRLYEERVFLLPGLALPEVALAGVDTFFQAEAVQLFIRAARRAQSDFHLQAADRLPLARLCHFLAGLPLALELAAAWVDTLPLAEIEAELRGDLDFLNQTLRNVDERHHSLRQVFEHSWGRLSPEEQAVLAALSVFRGRIDRAAAQAVARTPTGTPISPRHLSDLVHKSLLLYDRAGDRYEIHELLRQFTAAKLAENEGEATAVHQRHCAHYASFVAARAVELEGMQQAAALQAIEAAIDNIRLAWHEAITAGDWESLAKMMPGLFYFYDTRSWFQEGAQMFREARSTFGRPTTAVAAIVDAQLKARQFWFVFQLGHHRESIGFLMDSWLVLEKEEAYREAIFTLNYLGAAMRYLGNYEMAERYLQEAWRLAEQYGDRFQASISLSVLGQTALLQGVYLAARRYCQESLRLKRELGDRRGELYALLYLGRVALALAEYQEARLFFQESLAIGEALGDGRGQALALQNLGDTAVSLKQHDEAAAYYQAGLAIFRQIGNRLEVSACLLRLGETAVAQQELVAARPYFQEGLQIALAIRSVPKLLAGLLGLAQFWQQTGQPERALVCLAMVEHHPGSDLGHRLRAREMRGMMGRETAVKPTESDLTTFVKTQMVLIS
jgi:predicted ATPase/DNA-binding SARP family transcriptional activator